MTKPASTAPSSGRVFSGVQPSGHLHLGNYLGAIRNWVAMQDTHETLFCIVDLHAITVPQVPDELRAFTRTTAAAYIACGIDPTRSIIFPQSMVSAHAELAWILNCLTPLGWLNRMTQFKDKTQGHQMSLESYIKLVRGEIRTGKNNPEDLPMEKLIELIETGLHDIELNYTNTSKAKLGLYAYPVLMAADILAYKATHVPVGEDQKQHLELARDIAGAFNRAYAQEFFPLPEPLILGEATRVMSLRDGTAKMSKSDPSDYSRINLTDDAELIALKFRKAKSDMTPGISWEPEARPEVANLVTIYAALSGSTREQVVTQFAAAQFSEFKQALATLAAEKLGPITEKMRELTAHPKQLDEILADGAARADAIAAPILREVKSIVGFWQK